MTERLAELLDQAVVRAPQRIQRTKLGRRVLADIALRERYRIGRRFSAAIHQWLAPNRGHAMHETWLDYALSTNLRGAAIVEQLVCHKSVHGARALDVGCAYGGFSIAFAESGGSAVGIDVDSNLLGFAAKNVLDRGAAVVLVQVDATDGTRMQKLGSFDFVTCSDVIEHVADVPATLVNLAAALAPGGLLHLQIPNGESAALVLADGHFNVFGITLLERDDALRYFAEGKFGGAYDVQSYLPLENYFAMLEQFAVRPVGSGLRNVQGDTAEAIARVALLWDEIELARQPLPSDERFSAVTRAAIADASARYLDEGRALLRELRGERDLEHRRRLEQAFVVRYAIACWDVLAVKDA